MRPTLDGGDAPQMQSAPAMFTPKAKQISGASKIASVKFCESKATRRSRSGATARSGNAAIAEFHSKIAA